jgi:hypothetical protein
VKPVDFLFFIDHPVRELDAMTAVGKMLSDQGFTWELIPLRADQWTSLDRWHPVLACFTWFYFQEDKGFDRCRKYWPGTKYVNLAFEQSVQKINKRLKSPKHPYVLKEVWHSCWSEAYQQELIAKGVSPEKTRVNGSPVLGLYQEPYASLYPSREHLARMAGLDPAKRWILIPENYNAAFYDDVKVEEYVAAGEKREDVVAYIRWAEDSLYRLFDWLSRTPETVEVIFRPRPGVGMPAYLEKLGDRVGALPPSVHITDALTVREWVLRCDAVASNFSTTLIESGAAGRPTFMLAPMPFPEIVMNDWYGLVEQAPTEEAFQAMLSGGLAGDPAQLGGWARSVMTPHGDPIVRLAQWLTEVHREALGGDRHVDPLLDLDRRMRSGLKKARTAIKTRGSSVPPQDAFGQAEVARRVEDWERILGRVPKGSR